MHHYNTYCEAEQQQMAEQARLAYAGRDMSTARWHKALLRLNPRCAPGVAFPDEVLHQADEVAHRPEALRQLVPQLAALGLVATFENDTTLAFRHPHGRYQVTFSWKKHLSHPRPQPHLWLWLNGEQVSEHWFNGDEIVRVFGGQKGGEGK